MYFTSKFVSLLLAITVPVFSAQAAAVARNELAQLQVLLFDDTNLSGAAYSPDSLVQGVCSTLPGNWLDRPESVLIGAGFACTFFQFQGCAGTGTVLSGTVLTLPAELYDNTESFLCGKKI